MSQQSTILSLIQGAQADVDARFAQLLKDAAAVPADSVTPPPVVVPPVSNYKGKFRVSRGIHAYKLDQYGLAPNTPVTSMPDLIGTNDLKPANAVAQLPPLLQGKYPLYTKDGFIFLPNAPLLNYPTQLSGSSPQSLDVWQVITNAGYFISERLFGSWSGPWAATNNGNTGLRVRAEADNSIDIAWQYPNAVIPSWQPFLIRQRFTAIPKNTTYHQVETWINGVKLVGPNPVMTTYYMPQTYIMIGADTNNAHIGVSEMLVTPPGLSDADAQTITNEFIADYGIGKSINMPYASSASVVRGANSMTANYKYFSPNGIPEDPKGLSVRWIQYGSQGLNNSAYAPQYDGMVTVPAAFDGRVEIIPKDTSGNYFSLPATANTY